MGVRCPLVWPKPAEKHTPPCSRRRLVARSPCGRGFVTGPRKAGQGRPGSPSDRPAPRRSGRLPGGAAPLGPPGRWLVQTRPRLALLMSPFACTGGTRAGSLSHRFPTGSGSQESRSPSAAERRTPSGILFGRFLRIIIRQKPYLTETLFFRPEDGGVGAVWEADARPTRARVAMEGASATTAPRTAGGGRLRASGIGCRRNGTHPAPSPKDVLRPFPG